MKSTLILISVIVIVIFTYPTMYYVSSDTIEITIESKERVVTGSGDSISSKYLIYTDKGVFECTDSWLFFKFNSSDIYSKLKDGKTYKVHVAGWRIQFFSSYKNIISIE